MLYICKIQWVLFKFVCRWLTILSVLPSFLSEMGSQSVLCNKGKRLTSCYILFKARVLYYGWESYHWLTSVLMIFANEMLTIKWFRTRTILIFYLVLDWYICWFIHIFPFWAFVGTQFCVHNRDSIICFRFWCVQWT